MKTVVALISLLASLVLVGCSPGQSGSRAGGGGFQVTGYARALTDDQYDDLTDEQQYQVLNKLLGTIYKGMPVDEFFDVSAGLNNPTVPVHRWFSQHSHSIANGHGRVSAQRYRFFDCRSGFGG